MNGPDTYREWDPPAEWRHAVACCWVHEVGAERVHRVLPDGHADLLVHRTGIVEVVGLHDEVARPVLPAGTQVQGIRLRPATVAAAFGLSASELANRTVPADAVLGAGQARRLTRPDGLDAWIRAIRPHPRTTAALRLLAQQPVTEVADQLGLTTRHLRRILLADVGLAPKVFQRVVRFQRFVRAVDGGTSIAAAAADAGYADQPHVTREVHHLAGLTPARLVTERQAGALAGTADPAPT